VNKHKQNEVLKQPELMPYSEALSHLDPRVRTTHIGGEQFISVLDILQYHGNKKNPTQAWKTTLGFLEKQGFAGSPYLGEHQFEGKGQRLTPIVNLEGFLRIAQGAEVPEWEEIRSWLAKVGAEQLKSKAQRKRENDIGLYKKAGYGNAPEVLRLEAYNEALKEYAELKSTYTRVCENPDWKALANAEYVALFGLMANQLKAVLGNDNIRKALDTEQLDTMAFAERRLRGVLATQRDSLSNEEIQRIIEVVISPLGAYMRGLSELQGKDFLTGQPLIGKGRG
jgi:hypothetical protein